MKSVSNKGTSPISAIETDLLNPFIKTLLEPGESEDCARSCKILLDKEASSCLTREWSSRWLSCAVI